MSGPLLARGPDNIETSGDAYAMTANLRELLSELSIEAPIGYQRLRIIPLRPEGTSGLEYLTFDDSLAALVTIEESSPSGSVPELRVRNRAKNRVFIPDGSTLTGAKQNRVVNLSIMVAPESVTLIPVSCVERGRWRLLSPQFAVGGFADSPLRAKMCRGATESLKRSGKVNVDQGEVWRHVDDMLQSAGTSSPTAAYHALYEKWQPDLSDCEARLRLPKNVSGVAVEIDGLLQALDLFDKSNTLHKLWPRLVRSYLLAALRPEMPQGKKTEVKGFLEHLLNSEGECYEPAGVGTTIRLTNNEAVGSALVCEGQLVHLSVFASADPKPAGSEPPPMAPREDCPASQSGQNNPRRPWWRFWA
jgi:hypothetical protein